MGFACVCPRACGMGCCTCRMQSRRVSLLLTQPTCVCCFRDGGGVTRVVVRRGLPRAHPRACVVRPLWGSRQAPRLPISTSPHRRTRGAGSLKLMDLESSCVVVWVPPVMAAVAGTPRAVHSFFSAALVLVHARARRTAAAQAAAASALLLARGSARCVWSGLCCAQQQRCAGVRTCPLLLVLCPWLILHSRLDGSHAPSPHPCFSRGHHVCVSVCFSNPVRRQGWSGGGGPSTLAGWRRAWRCAWRAELSAAVRCGWGHGARACGMAAALL